MKLKELLETFTLEGSVERECIGNNPFTALQEPPQKFQKVAQAILSGYFRVQNSRTSECIEVHPTCVEIYYHEEQNNGVKDPIVYHRNRETKSGKNTPTVFPLGVLHNHVSGIDITFEHEADSSNTYITDIVRASALIREFSVIWKTKGETDYIVTKRIENEKHPTYIYDYLYGKFSIFDGFRIEWVDGEECELAEFKTRENVATYKHEDEGADFEKIKLENPPCKSKPYQQDLRRWQFRKKL